MVAHPCPPASIHHENGRPRSLALGDLGYLDFIRSHARQIFLSIGAIPKPLRSNHFHLPIITVFRRILIS